MFRELTRKHKALLLGECIAVLEREKRGVLSVLGDGGYPYGMPMNHLYKDGVIWFHCGRQKSHRNDALRQSDKVSYCVFEEGTPIEGNWALQVRSVIVFGRMEIVDDPETVADVCTDLCHKFTFDEEYIRHEMENSARGTLLLKLTPEHISGKTVTES